MSYLVLVAMVIGAPFNSKYDVLLFFLFFSFFDSYFFCMEVEDPFPDQGLCSDSEKFG